MTGVAIRAALVFALGTTGWRPGYAGRYDEQVMQRAAVIHGLPVADCMASDDLARLGSFVWVRGANTGRLLSCQVSDYSAPPDKQRHMRAGLVELDIASARAVCGHTTEPWRDCPVLILRR